MKLRLYSETIGMPVITPYHNRAIGYIRDILVDPESGGIIGFLFSRRHLITPIDVVSWNEGIVINEETNITEVHDVLRAKTFLQNPIPIMGQKVFTEEKEYLGRVYDMSFEGTLFSLYQIFVGKGFLFIRFGTHIIPRTNIVEITKKGIIVRSSMEKKRERVPLTNLAAAG